MWSVSIFTTTKLLHQPFLPTSTSANPVAVVFTAATCALLLLALSALLYCLRRRKTFSAHPTVTFFPCDAAVYRKTRNTADSPEIRPLLARQAWPATLDDEEQQFCSPRGKITESEVVCEPEESNSEDDVGVSDNEAETEILLHFLISLREEKKKQAARLEEVLNFLNEDIKEVERSYSLGTDSVFSLALKKNPDQVRGNDAHSQDSSNSDISRLIRRSFADEERLLSNINQLESSYFSARSRVLPKEASSVSSNDKNVMESEWRLPHVENVDTEPRRIQRSVACLASFCEGLCKFARYSKFEECGRSRVLPKEASSVSSNDKNVMESEWRLPRVEHVDKEPRRIQSSVACLASFCEGLCKFARYSKFEECGRLRNSDEFSSGNIMCALSLDRDEDYIAAGGISRKIKIFDLNAISSDSADIQYPVVQMSNESKLSSLCWNTCIQNHLASADYGGEIKIWDAGTGQLLSQYMEHQKRAWSVHISLSDPKMFASGSDDCSVKLWNINEKNSLETISMPANICCVQFSPPSTNLLFFGSADHKVYGYDLRHTRSPWCSLAGHEKSVSYVKFIDAEAVVTASTDNSLKLWNLKKISSSALSSDACDLTFKGHTNLKNFVGLSVSDGYIACGSESNEVYCYHKSLPVPVATHKFESIDPISDHPDKGQFVSSVCWRKKSNMLVAANSVGIVKLLQMV